MPLSQIKEIVQMNCSQEEKYRQCTEYYHGNCLSRTWDKLAYKIYQSEYCVRKQQTLEYMMEQNFMPPSGKQAAIIVSNACRYLITRIMLKIIIVSRCIIEFIPGFATGPKLINIFLLFDSAALQIENSHLKKLSRN